MKPTVEERFWGKVQRSDDPDACWPWMGSRTAQGYGVFTVNGKRQGAHRYAYELQNGPLPEGRQSCHGCDNPPCCRGSHLFSGTASENTRDMYAKGRRPSQFNGLRVPAEKPKNDHITRPKISEQMKRIWDERRSAAGVVPSYRIKTCGRCGHTWLAVAPRPVKCPACQSKAWDTKQ